MAVVAVECGDDVEGAAVHGLTLGALSLATFWLLVALPVLAPVSGLAQDRRQQTLACGGPATSFNHCLQVCGCKGGKRCYAACSNRDFNARIKAKAKGKRGKLRGSGGP